MNSPKLPKAAWIGAGVLAFALTVFAMVPPTKPLGGATIDPNAHHGLADLPSPAHRPVVRHLSVIQSEAVQTPDAVPGNAANASIPTGEDADEDGGTSANSAAALGARYARRDEYGGPDADQREYRAGYRWAADRNIDDPRACRAFERTPRGDGCFAFLRDADDRDAGDRGRR